MSQNYEPTELTQLRRKPGRGAHDAATIHAILDAGIMAHVGYVIDGQPFVTPTAYWSEGGQIFWHGAATGRAISAYGRGEPVCLTVSHLDGFVLARSGFATSVQYRSVMIFGRPQLIVERDRKRRAMEHFIERLWPGRLAEIRGPSGAELDAMSVVAMEIEAASAKFRADGVLEKREEDYERGCWAGVIPVALRIGEPAADARLSGPVGLPERLAAWRPGRRLDEVLALGATSKT